MRCALEALPWAPCPDSDVREYSKMEWFRVICETGEIFLPHMQLSTKLTLTFETHKPSVHATLRTLCLVRETQIGETPVAVGEDQRGWTNSHGPNFAYFKKEREGR